MSATTTTTNHKPRRSSSILSNPLVFQVLQDAHQSRPGHLTQRWIWFQLTSVRSMSSTTMLAIPSSVHQRKPPIASSPLLQEKKAKRALPLPRFSAPRPPRFSVCVDNVMEEGINTQEEELTSRAPQKCTCNQLAPSACTNDAILPVATSSWLFAAIVRPKRPSGSTMLARTSVEKRPLSLEIDRRETNISKVGNLRYCQALTHPLPAARYPSFQGPPPLSFRNRGSPGNSPTTWTFPCRTRQH